MAEYYAKADLDKAFADFNAALAKLPVYKFDAPVQPDMAKAYAPALTDDQALANCRMGLLMDGVTRSTDNQATLDERAANYVEWKDGDALKDVPEKSKEYGIMIGRIHDVSPFGIHTGTPKPTEMDYIALQTQVDEFNAAHQGGPSGG